MFLAAACVLTGACRKDPAAPPSPAAASAAAPASAPQPPALTLVGGDRETKLSFADLRALPSAQLTTRNPAYQGAQKRYVGVELKALLLRHGLTQLTDDYNVVFVCADGYKSELSASAVGRGGALLAFGEHDGRAEVRFPDVRFPSGKTVWPGPLYVVWATDRVERTYPNGWPFQLVRIELVREGSERNAINPRHLTTRPEVLAGFTVFDRLCVACHTMNGVGGGIGAELNRPLNITEYFLEAPLKQFIADWTTVRMPRGDEKMPRFGKLLSAEDIDHVVAYLRFMKDHKDR